MADSTRRRAAPVRRWFAPDGGFYRGVGPNGEASPRIGLPPKTPATEAGIRRQEREARRARRLAEATRADAADEAGGSGVGVDRPDR
ncbi:hypothetical protein [Cellulomonas sp. IC4_254]|uniref:hypothetical protein n=1 Tax=Cellulomonas sp. IC4_254 TaxID=2714040 RepID=UPI001420FBB2|nr:hypothetical protein [Cellulomonas sp. IC4_254]NHT19676.1 hypothetical protein [Cellulomonas sp. IC4_254]